MAQKKLISHTERSQWARSAIHTCFKSHMFNNQINVLFVEESLK